VSQWIHEIKQPCNSMFRCVFVCWDIGPEKWA